MEAYSITQPVVGTGLYSKQRNNASPSGKSSGPVSSSPSEDPVTLSREGKERSSRTGSGEKENTLHLDRQEIQQLQDLKRRDMEVRTHEQAHLAAAGRYARGSASFTLQKGPDGKSYAVGGEVGIDVGKESTPDATLAKMQTIKRAALAPANPSAADRRIAAQATVKEAQARQELLMKTQEELLQTISGDKPVGGDLQQPSLTGVGEQSKPSASYATLKSVKSMIAAYKNVAES